MSRAPAIAPRLAALAALALRPLLGGCLAAAAIPVLAGGAMAARGDGSDDERPEPARRPAPPATIARPAQAPAAAPAPTAGAPAARATASAAPLPPAPAPALRRPIGSGLPPASPLNLPRPLPAPQPPASPPLVGAMMPAPWQAFVAYALDRAAKPIKDGASSVLLKPLPSLASPEFRACGTSDPAVIIDLDTGKDAWNPSASPAAPPGLAGGLARLRAVGVQVIWLSSQSDEQEAALRAALARSGLDGARRDTLLLAGTSGERKQTLRERAAEDGCIIAIAGDGRGDFDEVFDYLRDPATASLLDFQLGQGWFLVPPPLG